MEIRNDRLKGMSCTELKKSTLSTIGKQSGMESYILTGASRMLTSSRLIFGWRRPLEQNIMTEKFEDFKGGAMEYFE